ncbi:MAG: beta-glucosidase [Spirochaetota bacterium]
MRRHRTPQTILADLSREEKIALTHGRFLSGGVPRLGIDQLELADGPVGIRLMGTKPVVAARDDGEVENTGADADAPPRVTALPASILLASTWSRSTARSYASLIGREMLALDKHVLLAPGVNLMRDPRDGRNFEYFGEDPYLTAELAVGYVRGLQEMGVGANLKHYVANECDRLRHFTSSNVDEKTLRELYVYPFERVVREADAWSLMTGNNLVNGEHVAESEALLRRLLRDEIGFDGVVLTDWRSAYRPAESARATVDMTTGMCSYVYGDGDFAALIASGEIDEALLDAMAFRILRLYERVGLLEPGSRPEGEVDTAAHRAAARAIAAEGMVLLRNEGSLLPLDTVGPIIVTGPGALQPEVGTGSGLVNGGAGNIGILDGLRSAFGEAAVDHVAETADVGRRLGHYGAARDAVTVVYCATGQPGGEGDDQDSIGLPGGQSDEIGALGRATDRLVVVLQAGSAVDVVDWHEHTDALLLAWYGGQATGDAVADILTGAVDPSGRLPCTFGNSIDDYPAAALGTWPARLVTDEHPGTAGRTKEERKQVYAFAADYRERTAIGYRWFEARGIEPLYPFGFGLSYTEFSFAAPAVEPAGAGWEVTCEVANTGRRPGSTVVQLYRRGPGNPAAGEEIAAGASSLRGFTRVRLEPGQEVRARLELRPNDLATYDVERGTWTVRAGTYELRLGPSSRQLPLSVSLTVVTPIEVEGP